MLSRCWFSVGSGKTACRRRSCPSHTCTLEWPGSAATGASWSKHRAARGNSNQNSIGLGSSTHTSCCSTLCCSRQLCCSRHSLTRTCAPHRTAYPACSCSRCSKRAWRSSRATTEASCPREEHWSESPGAFHSSALGARGHCECFDFTRALCIELSLSHTLKVSLGVPREGQGVHPRRASCGEDGKFAPVFL